jgi:hypothetical protein
MVPLLYFVPAVAGEGPGGGSALAMKGVAHRATSHIAERMRLMRRLNAEVKYGFPERLTRPRPASASWRCSTSC